jgi:glycosyltransferase involved in cell wall biosynthesis
VVSSSFAVAKGVITRPDALHVCYCHSPMRYVWDLEHTYRRDAGLDRGIRGILASFLFNYLRMWDVASATRPQVLMANSNFTASRIARYWSSDSQLPSPVDLSRFSVQSTKGRDYLTVSRLVPYKRHELMVQAFAALPDRRLLIIGDGPHRAALEKIATPNVVFLGALPDREVAERMRAARAFLFSAHEDFGIVPVEAQACGTPVIAYGVGGVGGVGGVRDTVRGWPMPQPTGLFFDQQTSESLREAVLRFETIEHAFDPQVLRDSADCFSNEHFRARLDEMVSAGLTEHGRAAAAAASSTGDHRQAPLPASPAIQASVQCSSPVGKRGVAVTL